MISFWHKSGSGRGIFQDFILYERATVSINATPYFLMNCCLYKHLAHLLHHCQSLGVFWDPNGKYSTSTADWKCPFYLCQVKIELRFKTQTTTTSSDCFNFCQPLTWPLCRFIFPYQMRHKQFKYIIKFETLQPLMGPALLRDISRLEDDFIIMFMSIVMLSIRTEMVRKLLRGHLSLLELSSAKYTRFNIHKELTILPLNVCICSSKMWFCPTESLM